MKRFGLFCFSNDLRLHDQPGLLQASQEVDALICVYVMDPRIVNANQYGLVGLSDHRQRFLKQSLMVLDQQLGRLNHSLVVLEGKLEYELAEIIDQYKISSVYRSKQAGWIENQTWLSLQTKYQQVRFIERDSHTLFDEAQLPFLLDELPVTFSKFKNIVADLLPTQAVPAVTELPPMIQLNKPFSGWLLNDVEPFNGGEVLGLQQCQAYFSDQLPLNYKYVRNALDGWQNSSKFSPWLANGCLSVRALYTRLLNFERTVKANESTYWLYFELLWREYFQWYAHRHGARLFAFKGIKGRAPLTSYYANRFQQWVNGTTPYPIVNSGMNELAATGYISNRVRQIVASCLVNELSLDWRYGAAYFEQQLIDYDVASNWGNWQYLAGVGADVKDKRHFNLEKQTQMFDPNRDYITRWKGDENLIPTDTVDAADWPISPGYDIQ